MKVSEADKSISDQWAQIAKDEEEITAEYLRKMKEIQNRRNALIGPEPKGKTQ